MPASRSDRAPSSDRVAEALHCLPEAGAEGWHDLAPLVYDELRAIAHNRLRGERGGHRLDTSELVHEAYLRLVDQTRVRWRDRAHFFAVASMVMRRILINEAHRRTARKRGGRRRRVSLREADASVIPGEPRERMHRRLALDGALEKLSERDQRQARVVEYRYLWGLSIEETAAALSVSPATVKRDWAAARVWLRRELGSAPRA